MICSWLSKMLNKVCLKLKLSSCPCAQNIYCITFNLNDQQCLNFFVLQSLKQAHKCIKCPDAAGHSCKRCPNRSEQCVAYGLLKPVE